jgi:multiple sugar transport system permease protein
MKKNLKQTLIPYSFIAPNFFGFLIFNLIPIVFSLGLAFSHWDGFHPLKFAALSNFATLFQDTQFRSALWNTIVFSMGTVPLTLIVAVFLAVLLNQGVRGTKFLRAVNFFPYIASIVAVAAVWNMLFSPSRGPVNSLLSSIGFTSVPGWASDKYWAMVTVVMFNVWKNSGYYMIIYLAGLQGIPFTLYEAANLDGCNAWQRFFYITLPQLRNTTFFVMTMLTIQSFKVFTSIYMITQGGPGTATLVMVYDIYNKAFVSWKLGLASSEALLLFVMVLIITFVQYLAGKRRNF